MFSFQWIGPPVSQVSGDEAVLNCPAIGYPPPRIIWFKNDILISKRTKLSLALSRQIRVKFINLVSIYSGNNATLSSTSSSPNGISTNGKKYLFTGQSLKIRALEADDEGDYKCIANNSFQLTVDGNAREFNLSLTQHLRVKCNIKNLKKTSRSISTQLSRTFLATTSYRYFDLPSFVGAHHLGYLQVEAVQQAIQAVQCGTKGVGLFFI